MLQRPALYQLIQSQPLFQLVSSTGMTRALLLRGSGTLRNLLPHSKFQFFHKHWDRRKGESYCSITAFWAWRKQLNALLHKTKELMPAQTRATYFRITAPHWTCCRTDTRVAHIMVTSANYTARSPWVTWLSLFNIFSKFTSWVRELVTTAWSVNCVGCLEDSLRISPTDFHRQLEVRGLLGHTWLSSSSLSGYFQTPCLLVPHSQGSQLSD